MKTMEVQFMNCSGYFAGEGSCDHGDEPSDSVNNRDTLE
jgi:hypothetical protein